MKSKCQRTFIAVASFLAFSSVAQAGCLDAPEPCRIPLGEYHIALPDIPTEGTLPVVVFLHGFGSHGGNSIGNRRLVNPILERGYAMIAPSGMPRRNGGGSSWVFHPKQEQRRDELEFINAVLDDAVQKHGLDRSRVLLAGFSEGAFMTSYLACRAPDAFAGFAPLAGGFWRPHPETCAGPVRLFQTHGWTDGTVPLEGRPLGGGYYLQGDIFQTLQIWRDANSCDQMRADERSTEGTYWRRKWTHCASDSALEFAMHPGGHILPKGWADMTLNWFEALPEQ
jgi:polyhydroxybutyrate depolymerase